jgi:predicted Ser/Thr protein kinase
VKCSLCGSENDAEASECFTCGEALSIPAAAVTRGTVINDRYEILEWLGRGGMGTVYRARDRMLEEEVALKILRKGTGRSGEVTRRFRLEILLARKVAHRNVCRIYEYGEDAGQHYISMELIDGIDLKRLIRERGVLSPSAALEIIAQVAEGLQAIHDVGIIHRDLKTSNLMKDAHGVVRVMDFGIAKRFAPDARASTIMASPHTATGQIVGTPDYISPEQARGQRIDLRTDIYSLGVVMYELFTGHVPFPADSPDDPMAARIPPPLLPVLEKALAKDPTHRYQSVRSLLDAMRNLNIGKEGSKPGRLGRASAVGNLARALWEFAEGVPTAIGTRPATAIDLQTIPDQTVVARTVSMAASGGQTMASRWVVYPRRPRWAAGAVTFLIAVGLILLALSSRREPPVPAAPAAVDTGGITGAIPSPARFTVRFNALPWARITMRPLGHAARIPELPEEERTTPCTMDLLPGDYWLELENGGITPPLVERIRVAADGTNEYSFTMPSYDPEAAAARNGWSR